MNRRLLLPFFALSLLTTGCFGDIAGGLAEGIGEGLECVGVAFGHALGSAVEEPIRSEGGGHLLYGICSVDEPCEQVVMVGAELSLWVDDDDPNAPDGDGLRSGSSTTVTVVEHVDDCGIPAAAITATEAGQATIVLVDGISTIDTFAFEVAEASSLRLGYGHVDEPEVIGLPPGQTTVISARIHDADDRPLAAGSAVRWSSSAPEIVSFVDGDVGQRTQLEAGTPGTATITAEVAGMTTSVEVQVGGDS